MNENKTLKHIIFFLLMTDLVSLIIMLSINLWAFQTLLWINFYTFLSIPVLNWLLTKTTDKGIEMNYRLAFGIILLLMSVIAFISYGIVIVYCSGCNSLMQLSVAIITLIISLYLIGRSREKETERVL
jgi:hypothetical protein